MESTSRTSRPPGQMGLPFGTFSFFFSPFPSFPPLTTTNSPTQQQQSALMSSFKPELIAFDTLSAETKEENFKAAFAAGESLGLEAAIDVVSFPSSNNTPLIF